MQILDRAAIRSFTKVRLVSKDANEILPALEAWTRADEKGLDLVLVSDQVTPPVVRIQDYKKIQYEKKKARAKQVKNKTSLKEVQLKANISDHDLQTKVKNIEKFLDRGDKVKITVRLKGRERDNPERAQELLDRVREFVTVSHKFSKVRSPMATALLEPVSSK